MRRREFIIVVGAAAVWPRAVRAQQPKIPRIGILVLGNPNPEPFWKAFREGLREQGYVDRENIMLEFRSAAGNPNLLADLAAELVRLKVEVIVAYQTPAATAAKLATSVIPIVMAPAGDPVGTGLVASLANPGGNVTGLSGTNAEIVGKNLEFIREILPSVRRVAVMANATDPFTKPFLGQIQAAAQTIGVQLRSFMIRGTEDLETSFKELATDSVDAVLIQPSISRRRAAELALKQRLPTVSPTRPFTEEGGLLSYSASSADLFTKAAVYVDKILKGSKPADLPVQQPTKFELVINLKTARELGLTVPPTLLARADEVIE